MRLDAQEARDRFRTARVAHLATVGPGGDPHVIPIVFAWCEPDALVFAVDHKPKSGKPLRRVENLRAHPAVSALTDVWSEDWSQLWWARADGTARVLADADARRSVAIDALVRRYPQYRDRPPEGPVTWIDVGAWSGWSGES